MQKGDIVRARFLTMPEPFPGAGVTKDNLYPVRKATVVYVHPKGRYIVAECKGVNEKRGHHVGVLFFRHGLV